MPQIATFDGGADGRVDGSAIRVQSRNRASMSQDKADNAALEAI
jgi:hypothetical protein